MNNTDNSHQLTYGRNSLCSFPILTVEHGHSFLVLVNGDLQGGWSPPIRGIRHISSGPATFCPCSECPSCLHEPGLRTGLLSGFHMPSYRAGIPLPQYADDTSFFMRDSEEEAWNLSMLVHLFLDCLGLQNNELLLGLVCVMRRRFNAQQPWGCRLRLYPCMT